MPETTPDLDPYLHDPDRWGHSLAQSNELLLPCLDAAGATSVYEVGAFAGDLTRFLVHWAAGAGARVGAIDPFPQPGLEELAREHPELDLVRRTSLDALPELEVPDAVVIDGDHNWHVVTEELVTIAERAGERLPLVLLHDVNWPHARRDDYYDPALVPEDRRHPVAGEDAGIAPDDPGVRPGGGLPYPRSAAHEGGPRNGVLTAVEDFVGAREDLRLVVVPSWFGFGVVWHREQPYADALEALLAPWDRNPLVARLERNRVHQLAARHSAEAEVWRLRERLARRDAVLGRLLGSSAFGLAERLSGLRRRVGVAPGSAAVGREEVRRAMRD